MSLKMIVATDPNGLIGIDNKLPWNCPEDMKIFREKTMGGIVVMGKNTYLSIPEKNRPLKGRVNVVLSSTLKDDNVTVVNKEQLDELIQKHKESGETIWLIGGKQLYTMYIDQVDEIHHTTIFHPVHGEEFEGNVYLMEIFKYTNNFTLGEYSLLTFQGKGDINKMKVSVYHRKK